MTNVGSLKTSLSEWKRQKPMHELAWTSEAFQFSRSRNCYVQQFG